MRVFILFFVLSISICTSQQNISSDYFVHPVDIPIAVSGTYGELRSNHFHSGLDIRTNGEEGLPVIAAASGTISRIKISFFGYGKAIYITHPNGYTSVYAHLKKFSPEIEAYVKKRQYAKEAYEIELFPKSGSLSVKKGEIIAYSGNTGGSGGPHLHFEIRDGKARPMNPLNFGITVADSKKPVINSLWLYNIDSGEKTQLRITPQEDGTYESEKITTQGKIGIGISTIDQQDLSSNRNGIYQISTEVNGQKNFELKMDRFSFSETRYINRLIDYGYYKKNRSRITKLFIEKNNPLSIYKNTAGNGMVSIEKGLSYTIRVTVKDHAGNSSIIQIPIEGTQSEEIPKRVVNDSLYLVQPNENFTYSSGIFDVFIPKGSVYDNAYIRIEDSGDTIHIHEDIIPLHKKMTIVFDVSNYKEEDRKKLYIGELGYNGKHYFCTTQKKGNRFSARSRTLGSYSLFSDFEKPTIVPINVADKKWISGEDFLKIKINDKESGIKSYNATINGKFILMEYDYKTGMLIYDFNDKVITESQNNFKLIVLDKVGNSTTFETTFFRKP